jgi:hypothetical protein
VPEYVELATKFLLQEEERAERYYPLSKKIIISRIEHELIVNHAQTLAFVSSITCCFHVSQHHKI